MKDTIKAQNYREKYKQYYGIDFGSDCAIHHIDFNRSNNDIDNLLLLPRNLHAKYHMCLSSCADKEHKINGIIGEWDKYQLKELKNLVEALEEISRWVKWKQYNYDAFSKTFIFTEKREGERIKCKK